MAQTSKGRHGPLGLIKKQPPKWFKSGEIWHRKVPGASRFACGMRSTHVNNPSKPPGPEFKCAACAGRHRGPGGAGVSDAQTGTDNPVPKEKKKRTRPKCRQCGKNAQKGIRLCPTCAVAEGFRKCTTCTGVITPKRDGDRRRKCDKCKEKSAWNANYGEISVRAVSGGLPTLGKRR